MTILGKKGLSTSPRREGWSRPNARHAIMPKLPMFLNVFNGRLYEGPATEACKILTLAGRFQTSAPRFWEREAGAHEA